MERQLTNAFILHRHPATNWSAFIDYWAKTYNYLSENSDYDLFVAERDATFAFDKTNLRKLFEWKNKTGDKLASNKEGTINKMIGKLPDINRLREEWDDRLFSKQFGKIGIVWQTFLMHIIQPDQFPIFDQHVYRAYTYLQNGKGEELKGTPKQKLELYTVYQAFFNEVKQASGCKSRDLDMAFWEFGKFIKQYKSLR